MLIPHEAAEDVYRRALNDYHRLATECAAYRQVRSSQQRKDALREQREFVLALERAFPHLKRIRRKEEAKPCTLLDCLEENLCLPALEKEEVK